MNRRGLLIAIAGAAAAEGAAAQQPGTIALGNAPSGQLPAGFETARTGQGAPAAWSVLEDTSVPSGKVLAQISTDQTDNRFPLAIYQSIIARDVEVSVRFKAVSGRIDRAGGIAVRLSDADNYYVARANALENNVTIYHTISGRRTEKKRANMKVPTNQWHTLRVEFQGSHFTVSLNGQKALDWDDETFKDAGKVGVWTKADSVTLFDDFSYGSK